MTSTIVAAWLLTYLLHSTVILAAALAASHLLAGRHLALQETLLRTALVGGVVTASLQLGFGIAPLAGEFSLNAAVQPAVATVIDPGPAVTSGSPLMATFSPHPEKSVWTTAFVVVWAVASILALVGVGRSILDLRRLLKSRCIQSAGRLLETLAAAMGLRRRVRISTSKAVAVPFATGIRRPEICCPERVDDLALEHKRSLFAHELAHLARRDPAWQLVYRLGEALLVAQPLNRLVRRRLEELAEHLADDRAAASTGDRLGLARCLVVVAHWGHSEGIGLPATALASGPRLDRRVRRLISRSSERHIDGRWAAAIGAAIVTASALLLPVVAAPPVHAGSTEDSVTESRTWSDADDRPAETAPAAEPAPEPATAPDAPADIPEAAEAAPSPASPPSAPARPEAVPASETLPAPETPPAAPAPETPATIAEPNSVPAPAAAPVPAQAPEPATPAPRATAAETERRREEARQRESERAQDRARTEARARSQRQTAREQSERARELAREAADRVRLRQDAIAERQIRVRQLEEEATRLAREAAVAERDRSEASRAEALAMARRSSLRARQLSDEQREAMRQKAVQMRKRAEAEQLEAQVVAEERARELADRARALAEQAEAERREQEPEKKD